MSLNVRNLKITLDSKENIVDSISFELKKGQMLSIVGNSGAGKSSICKAIMGLLSDVYHVSGEITYQNENLLHLPKKKLLNIYGKEICYISQNPMTAFNPSIRIGKQLEYTYLQHNQKIPRAEILKHIESTLIRLGMNDIDRILKSYPFALSGGMLQRIMIGVALINNPQILIADEATTAIDACNKMALMKELQSLCNEGMSILFVTHDLKMASKANKILIMNTGKLVEYGETKSILENPKVDYTKSLLDACYLERR